MSKYIVVSRVAVETFGLVYIKIKKFFIIYDFVQVQPLLSYLSRGQFGTWSLVFAHNILIQLLVV